MKYRTIPVLTALAALLAPPSLPLLRGADGEAFVSKEEYNRLLQRYEQLERQMQQIQQKLEAGTTNPPGAATALTPPSGFATQTALEDLRRQVEEAQAMAHTTWPGTTKLNLSGYGSAGFIYEHHGGARQFTAQFNPLFLWKLSDRLFFEGELEFELEGAETSAALEQAHLSYLLNDYMTLDAGKFLNPMDSFVERFHMAWANRLPNTPLAVYDGLLPETFVGAQVRGGFDVGPTKLNYSVFGANAPSLIRDPNDPNLGTLAFDNFDNGDGNFVGGGHVGFLPIPEVEIGYGMLFGNVGPSDTRTYAFLQSADLNIVKDSQLLRGLVRANAQWVWSRVGDYPYNADGANPGLPSPFLFTNHRDGGYAQLTYRPTKWNSECLSKLELVFRFDILRQKDTPTGFDEHRYTPGINYWLGPATVLKAAYQFDDREGDVSRNALLVQFASGF